MKVPEDPFGTPISELLEQVTASTTLSDLLVNSPVASNIVDKVRKAVEVKAEQAEISINGVTAEEFSRAIEEGIEALGDILI